VQYNIAQILVTVPEGASPDAIAQRKGARRRCAGARQGGEAFDAVARELSEDGNRAQGGEIGLRPADRLPDCLRRGGAQHEGGRGIADAVAQRRRLSRPQARRTGRTATPSPPRRRMRGHILLRVSEQLSAEAAGRRLAEFKRQILAGTRSFEQLARENSEDGSAAAGGDLGWASPGTFVPEFGGDAMDSPPPRFNGISDPMHLALRRCT
jgi:peptidyl-prolyl cis-trans isomerase SurA